MKANFYADHRENKLLSSQVLENFFRARIYCSKRPKFLYFCLLEDKDERKFCKK